MENAAPNATPYAVADAMALERELGLSPAAAAILVRRGYRDAGSARAFLEGADRHDPELLHGIGEACELILGHVGRRSPIVVFGDYDVDGVCSTAVMVSALRAVGANPTWRLPSRAEGYGLNEAAIRELAAAGAALMVTVDCGVTAIPEIELAQSLGLEVVVTDHHRPGAALPPCPVVHPALGSYPAPDLCAAAVALKVSEALRARAGADPAAAEEDLDLAGLATVCDMVPLRGENRRIAREGLTALARSRRPGVRALMRVAALEPGDLDAHCASFRLGPRLNAAGRLHRADAALELLMTEDEERAEQVAQELDRINHDRRETEQRILHEAEALAAEQAAAGAIVVAGEGWHHGVVGIVASRLVERYRRPCVVIGLDGGRGRGSARSIAAYDIHAGISACAERLDRFGGHAMAAGLELAEDAIPAFRAALAAHAGAALSPRDLVRTQHIDAVVGAGALDLGLAEELERLGPFGAGNPSPVLLVPAARVEHVTAMGAEREHARFSLAGGGARARGVAFRTSQRSLASAGARPHDAAVSLERNRWNGAVEARIVLRSLSPTLDGHVCEIGGQALPEAIEHELGCDAQAWWDHEAEGAPPARDRRGESFAGVAGELLLSGEPVLVVVADAPRRAKGLAPVVAGMAGAQGLSIVEWECLARDPALAGPYSHLLALDPPPAPEGTGLLTGAAAGAGALAHLAWGEAEREFALACWRDRLALRPALAELWRTLARHGELSGEELERALCGDAPTPRGGRLCGRLVRVLCELGLAAYEPGAAHRLRAASDARTELDRSPAFRAYAARLAQAERHLASSAPDARKAAA